MNTARILSVAAATVSGVMLLAPAAVLAAEVDEPSRLRSRIQEFQMQADLTCSNLQEHIDDILARAAEREQNMESRVDARQERMQTRLQELEAEGVDTTELRAVLAEAETQRAELLQTREQHLEQLRALQDLDCDTEAGQAAFEQLQTQQQEHMQDMQQVREQLHEQLEALLPEGEHLGPPAEPMGQMMHKRANAAAE